MKQYIVALAIVIFGLASLPYRCMAQPDANYVKSETMLDPQQNNKITSYQFYDGLGRPYQTASDGISPNGRYVYSHKNYEGYNLIDKEWLPVVGSGIPEVKSEDGITESSKTMYNDNFGYASNEYDALGRIISTCRGGEAWNKAGKNAKIKYTSNDSLSVKYYMAPLDNKNSLKQSGYYNPGTLYGEETTDEDGHVITVFTDKLGKKILERRRINNNNNDTYFVYNDLDQLRFVLMPKYQYFGYKATFAYEYRYDYRGRMVKKILPGCNYIQYWYDNNDRMTFMQDDNLRQKGKYRFMLYDKFNRLAVQGLCTNCNRNDKLYPLVTFSESNAGFANTNYSLNLSNLLTNPEIEKVNYYDGYYFINGFNKDYFNKIKLVEEETELVNTGKNNSSSSESKTQYPPIDASKGMYETPKKKHYYDAKTGKEISGPEDGLPIDTAFKICQLPDDSSAVPYIKKELSTDSLLTKLNPTGDLLSLDNYVLYMDSRSVIKRSETGLLTGSIVANSDNHYNYSIFLYNSKELLCQTSNLLANGDNEISVTDYSFTGNPTNVSYELQHDGKSIFHCNTKSTYNIHNDKPENVTLSLTPNSCKPVQKKIAEYKYDDLGKIKNIVRPNNVGNVGYTYNLRGWVTGITTNSFKEQLFYEDNGGLTTPCYNGNISLQKWQNKNYYKIRGYKFSYNNLNWLTKATYGEDATIDINPNRYDEAVLEYDANGNMKRFQRRGKKQNGEYGKIDNLHLSYNGNQLSGVIDDAEKLLYTGAFDFKGKSNGTYTYNGNGALTSDSEKGIAKIEYDNNNLPKRIQFTNGNVTEYVYTVTGQKLRTIHYTAIPNMTVAMGSTHILSENEIQLKDSTDYLMGGNLIMNNGRLDKYLFAGGYCNIDTISDKDMMFHYYNQDHLGNNREVVNENGTIEQVTNYYPFGAPYCDNTNTNADLQPYKYNGKELDLTHGLNTYDYGARQYNSIVPSWT
nr:hypothetical protein [Prevotella sp.]